jgi:hypothetical protein
VRIPADIYRKIEFIPAIIKGLAQAFFLRVRKLFCHALEGFSKEI